MAELPTKASPTRGRLPFGKDARLLTKGDFQHAFANGRRKHFASLTVYCAPPRPGSPGSTVRIGIAVPKRQLKRAVDRNRVKRVLRETMRLERQDLVPCDLVFLCRRNALDPGILRADLDRVVRAFRLRRG